MEPDSGENKIPSGKPPTPSGYPFRTVISGSPAHKGPQTWLRGTFCCFRKIEGGWSIWSVIWVYGIRLSEHDTKTSMTVVDGGGLKSTLLEMVWAYFAHVRNVLLCMRLQTTKPRNTSSMSLVLLVQPLRFWFADFGFSAFFSVPF